MTRDGVEVEGWLLLRHFWFRLVRFTAMDFVAFRSWIGLPGMCIYLIKL